MVALLVAAVVAVGALILVTLPAQSGRFRLPGLTAPVTVTFGPRGVPFIRAANADDAAEALGYLHARARLFQMELLRRAAEGRLSAWFGKRTLGMDEHMRTLGIEQAAIASERHLSPRARALLGAYARGVNAWIAQRGRLSAWEFLIYGKPQPWRVRDSLLWGELLAEELSGNATVELERLALSRQMPRTKIDQLWPKVAVPPPDTASLAPAPGEARAALAALAAIPRFPAPFTGPRTASNEWAVAGPRSATGAPLLAGDPHLGFQFPGLWYLARIDAGHEILAGATAPGAPFLVFGHNRHIAWTFTNNGAAVQDIFTFRRVGKNHYQGPNGVLGFGIERETIEVAGHKPVRFVVRATIDGPVVGLSRHTALALDAANLTHDDRAADGLMRLDTAASLHDAERAAGAITTPVENLLVASRRRIGLIVTGCVPLRGAGDGAWPLDGGKASDQWTGLACGKALPRIIAPPSNVLVNTNEPVAPKGFPIDFGPDQFGDWRSVAIRAALARHRRLTVAAFAAIQHDVVSAYARQLLPVLDAIRPNTALARRAVALLRGWNGAMRRRLPQPLIFNAWLRGFRHAVLARNHVPPALAGPAHMQFVQALLTTRRGAQDWCGGNCATILAASADRAMAALAKRYGGDPARWRWAGPHRAVFPDTLLGTLPLIGRFISPSIAVPGDGGTVDRSAPAPNGWVAVQGPSYRGVYDLADLNRSRFIVAPGESGDIFSPEARDFLKPWRDGQTVALPAQPRHAHGTLTLVP